MCALWRAHLGHDVERLAGLAEQRLAAPLPAGLGNYRQLCSSATAPPWAWPTRPPLKLREASLSWSEAYPAMELRHGPISLLEAHSLVWSLDELPPASTKT